MSELPQPSEGQFTSFLKMVILKLSSGAAYGVRVQKETESSFYIDTLAADAENQGTGVGREDSPN